MNNSLLLKKSIYASIIVFSISFLVMFAFLPSLMFDGFNEKYAIIFGSCCVLLTLSSIAVFTLAIIMIVKIVSDPTASTNDKIVWSILTYAFSTFVLAFAYEKIIVKSNNYKDATKLVIFHGISIGLSMVLYIVFFIQMMNNMNF